MTIYQLITLYKWRQSTCIGWKPEERFDLFVKERDVIPRSNLSSLRSDISY